MSKQPVFVNLILPLLAVFLVSGFCPAKTVTDSLEIQSLLKKAETNVNLDPSKTVQYARKVLNRPGKEKQQQIEALYYIGYAYYNKNNYDSATTYLHSALDLATQIDNKKWIALVKNRLGNTYQLMGSYDKALENYQQALALNRETMEQREIARSLTNIGSIYRTFGNFDKAIQFHLKALDIYEKQEEKDGLAWTSLNIARLFKLNDSYPKAREYLDRAYEIYKQIEEEKGISTGVTLCLKEYGLIEARAGNLDKALEYSTAVLGRNKKNDNKYGIANTLINIGKIYYEKDNYSRSLEYLKEALSMKQELEDRLDLPALLRLIGDNYLQKGNETIALDYYERSLSQAEKQNLKNELRKTYYSLSKGYREKGNYPRAYKYYTMYSRLKDSLANQHIDELEMQYEFEKEQEKLKFEQKRQQAIQRAKLKRQKIITWSFIIGFGLVLLLLFVIYRSYRRKIETNRQLEQQKEEIETQRDEIEKQRDLATKQRDKIARQNTIITESMEYASRIQTAVLPQENTMNDLFYDYFVLYKPKNIVSGDFYWVSQVNGKTIVAAADCTGHGVPGAFMSMLGVAFLNEIVNQSKVLNPEQILNQLRSHVIEALHQNIKKRGSRDGMDIALAVIDSEKNMLYYSGAYNPVYIVRNDEIHEIKADRMPIGVHAVLQDTSFSVKSFQLQSDDKLYFFSDGFHDQFGGEKGLKFGRKAFKQMLIHNNQKSMAEQEQTMETIIEDWKNSWPQIDDIMVLGFHYNSNHQG
jgi:serine phosphatase RsbU (regulator of sigma subunit)/predicted negative regulator of RcsB-dependent stress response